MSYNMDGYIQVVDRIKLFYARYPEGSLQMGTPTFIDIGEQKWVMGRAYAYRTPTDERPGVGTAWEIVPGTTNFTRGSEIQNLESSAWGRAIGSLGIGITASIATMDEVEQAKERGKVMRTTETPPDDPWQTEALSPLSLSPEVVRPKKDSHSTGKTSKGSSMYPATAPQLKAVHAIMGKQGLNDDLDKLAKVNEYLVGLNKEPVGAISEVDKHQCSLLIDHLQAGLNPP
tara:strand:- start:880 stop:1569 length:690 start_codon:yes stop_codon:yes gene_type:complete